jgi:hypothetical protein
MAKTKKGAAEDVATIVVRANPPYIFFPDCVVFRGYFSTGLLFKCFFLIAVIFEVKSDGASKCEACSNLHYMHLLKRMNIFRGLLVSDYG